MAAWSFVQPSSIDSIFAASPMKSLYAAIQANNPDEPIPKHVEDGANIKSLGAGDIELVPLRFERRTPNRLTLHTELYLPNRGCVFSYTEAGNRDDLVELSRHFWTFKVMKH